MATAPAISFPALGTDAYGSGKREATRAFYEEYFELTADAQAVVTRVAAGSAPQAFKDGFIETLQALTAAVAS